MYQRAKKTLEIYRSEKESESHSENDDNEKNSHISHKR